MPMIHQDFIQHTERGKHELLYKIILKSFELLTLSWKRTVWLNLN